MAKTPEPTSTAPLAAYRVQGGKFAAYDATGRAWIIPQDQAEALGIREAQA
jgi:hypothetical protein